MSEKIVRSKNVQKVREEIENKKKEGAFTTRIKTERDKLKEREHTFPSFVDVERRAISMFESWIEEAKQDFLAASISLNEDSKQESDEEFTNRLVKQNRERWDWFVKWFGA